MTPRPPAACHHELRPGTKVCLHCRRAQREATATRHRAIFTKLGLVAAAVAACVFAGISGLDAWKQRSGGGLGSLISSPASLEAAPVPHAGSAAAPVSSVASSTVLASPVSAPPDAPSATVPPVSQVASVTLPAGSAAPAPSASAPAPVTSAPAAPVPPAASASGVSVRPVIVEGRTELQNGIYALRSGDTVTVHFDTPEARTRRPEKFEQIVRATLPAVHGRAADSLLSAVANGNLVGDTDLLADRPVRAIQLRGRDGQSLSLWPQTRPGRDGPLVVAYRVTSSR